MSEDAIVTYHKAIELLSRLSLISRAELEEVQSRLKQEAARVVNQHGDDSVALRSIANACQVYLDAGD